MLELFPKPPPSFVSTPVTNPNLDSSSGAGAAAVIERPTSNDRSIRIPARRRRPSTMRPADELHRRRLRAGTKAGMIDAIHSVLEGLEDPPFELAGDQRAWLSGL